MKFNELVVEWILDFVLEVSCLVIEYFKCVFFIVLIIFLFCMLVLLLLDELYGFVLFG